jgi:hypothetical protein
MLDTLLSLGVSSSWVGQSQMPGQFMPVIPATWEAEVGGSQSKADLAKV